MVLMASLQSIATDNTHTHTHFVKTERDIDLCEIWKKNNNIIVKKIIGLKM